MSNLALLARSGVDTNHLMFCLFSDTSSFMVFSSFSSAFLLLHNRTWSICTTPVTFLRTRSPGTRPAATWWDSSWHCGEDLHNLLYVKCFPHLFKKPKNKWIDRTSTKPKGKFFMEFTLSSKYLRKCNSKQVAWHWQMWTEVMSGVMYKARQTFCLDLFLLVA